MYFLLQLILVYYVYYCYGVVLIYECYKFVPSIIFAMLPEDLDTHQLSVKLLLDLHLFQLYNCV